MKPDVDTQGKQKREPAGSASAERNAVMERRNLNWYFNIP